MFAYPKLDLAKYTTNSKLDVDNTLARAVLKNSEGDPTMSDEDTKVAIVSLLNTCRVQQQFIDELVECVNEMRAAKPKRKLKFPFRKK